MGRRGITSGHDKGAWCIRDAITNVTTNKGPVTAIVLVARLHARLPRPAHVVQSVSSRRSKGLSCPSRTSGRSTSSRAYGVAQVVSPLCTPPYGVHRAHHSMYLRGGIMPLRNQRLRGARFYEHKRPAPHFPAAAAIYTPIKARRATWKQTERRHVGRRAGRRSEPSRWLGCGGVEAGGRQGEGRGRC